MVHRLRVTIVHDGGARRTYPADLIGSQVVVFPPMSEGRRFRLKDGRATTRRLAMWRLDEVDLRRCRMMASRHATRLGCGNPGITSTKGKRR